MNFSKLDALIDSLPACGIPSADLAVTYRGESVYRHSAGFADAEGTRPVSADDLYFIFSISKITTCVCGMRLVEEGKLGLDDPVSKYLPAYRYLTVKAENGKIVPAQNVMTIRHLFAMTGGLNYNLRSPSLVRAFMNEKPNTLMLVNAIAETPLEFEPGTRYQYSLCHDVLAGVIEVVSGMRFADYVQKTVFDPLGMTRTGYHLPKELLPRLSDIYNFKHGLMQPIVAPKENPYTMTDDYDSGGAGLYSCVDDQIKLMTVLANGGKTADGYSLLKPETVAMMQVGQLPDSARPQFGPTRLFGYSWGLCGRVHVDPVVSHALSPVGEFGWDGAAGAFALIDPTEHVAIYYGMHVKGCQYAYHVVHPKIRDLVYEIIREQ